ncbi:spermatogenesis- and oogenesis-specific basic helix-loop-helix-containing protein 1 [Ctenodactylus gundi]
MASRGSELPAGVPGVPVFGRNSLALGAALLSDSSASEGPAAFEDPGQSAGAAKGPVVAEGPGSCLPRNVLSERERRKRISASCERLRALLPHFSGRREDMASVLEMAVQFLRLAHSLAPSWGQRAVSASSREAWCTWQEDGLSWSVARPPSLAPRPSPWPPGSQQQAAPSKVREGGPKEAPAKAASSPAPLTKADALQPAPDARSVLGGSVEDGVTFLLTASPDWWLGSLDGRSATPPGALDGSSPATKAEPGFPGDSIPSSQEFADSPMGPWGSELGSWGLDLRDDEDDGVFPDFLGS